MTGQIEDADGQLSFVIQRCVQLKQTTEKETNALQMSEYGRIRKMSLIEKNTTKWYPQF